MEQPGKNRTGAILHTAIINTGRLAELAEFYSSGLELGPASYTEENHIGYALPNAYFGFDKVDKERLEYPGAVSLWFAVEDLDATFNRFVALGAKVMYPPTQKPWGATLAAVFDPDGNVLGLTQRGAESAGA